jgi:hypothetical protein
MMFFLGGQKTTFKDYFLARRLCFQHPPTQSKCSYDLLWYRVLGRRSEHLVSQRPTKAKPLQDDAEGCVRRFLRVCNKKQNIHGEESGF